MLFRTTFRAYYRNTAQKAAPSPGEPKSARARHRRQYPDHVRTLHRHQTTQTPPPLPPLSP